VTHTLESVVGSKRAVIGVNDRGGGYINSVLLHGFGIDGVDIVVTDFGKGWQGSVRDNLHGGRYNPTQAGIRDQFGAPVSVVKNSTLLVEQFAMPLYGDPVFDFLANETGGVADAYPKDGGNSDADFRVLKLRSMKSCDPSSITRSCFATLRPGSDCRRSRGPSTTCTPGRLRRSDSSLILGRSTQAARMPDSPSFSQGTAFGTPR
jgi:hypothetical protein